MKKIDQEQALAVLEMAYQRITADDYTSSSEFNQQISEILYNNHLTYKYILINALLAKATNPEINALCLQVKSPLDGAYDARSLCHKVIVPFERKYFNNGLGSSNEPFLNKPARFPTISRENAVRKGNDQKLLYLLCEFLPQIETQKQAFDALSDAIFFAVSIAKEKDEIFGIQSIKIPAYSDINAIVDSLLSESFEGQTLALAIGGLMHMLAHSLDGETRVDVHIVNQSGASSKEVSDIDVYLDNQLIYAIEAKDKLFTAHDVGHAVGKVSAAGHNRLMFIKGPRAILQNTTEDNLVSEARIIGVYLTFLSLSDFTKMILSIVFPSSIGSFFNGLLEIVKEARLKDETRDFMLEVCRKNNLID